MSARRPPPRGGSPQLDAPPRSGEPCDVDGAPFRDERERRAPTSGSPSIGGAPHEGALSRGGGGSRYHLLLLDLDGTLLTSTRTIHPENVRVLRACMDAGVRVGFATGRPPLSVAPFVDALRPNAPFIHMNGGLVRDFATRAVIHARTLSSTTACTILERARGRAWHANVYVGDEIWIEARTPTSRESEEKDGVPHVVVPDLAARLLRERVEPLKIMLIAPAGEIAGLARVLADVDATLVNSEPTYLEALPRGCSKGAAARALAAHLGIGMDEVMAFGDNKNDLELLTTCGLGVAMANAHDDVLARVPVKIGHHDTDAIARFLEGFDVIDRALVASDRGARGGGAAATGGAR